MKVLIPGGEVFDLGTTETNPTVGITDYSRRVTDDYGVTTVVERGFSRRMSVRLSVPIGSVDAIQRKLAALRATSAQWVANERFACLSVNGFFKDFDLDLNTPPISYCTLNVEGLLETEPFTDPGGDPAPSGLASTLKLLQPSTITNATLIASNVAETDYPTWSSGTSYALGARVVAGGTHRIYESTVPGNVGIDPTAPTGKWSDIGPTNRWAMFDQALGSTTDATGSIAVTVDAAAIGAVALLDVVGATVRVQATGYDRTVAVGAGAITFLDLPSSTTRVSVTIAGSGAVSVGTLLVGKLVGLGLTESSPTAGITDYSRKDVDDFGAVTIVERAWAKRMSQNALIDTSAIDAVFARLAAVRATPALWIGQDGFDSLTIYGFFKEFTITPGEAVSKLALSIEGLSTAGKILPFAPGAGDIEWPDVGDAAGTKPADNATVGAPNGTHVGSKPVDDLVIEHDKALADIDHLIDNVRGLENDTGVLRQDFDDFSANLNDPGGNLLANTNFVTTDGWSSQGNYPNGPPEASWQINAGPDEYHPTGENVLSMIQGAPKGAGTYIEWASQRFPLSKGTMPFFQFYGWLNSHRAPVSVSLVMENVNGQITYISDQSARPTYGGFGNTPDGFIQYGEKSVPVPEGTARGYYLFRKYDTNAGETSSYAWLWRPYGGQATEGQTEWNPYVAGTGAALEAAAIAEITRVREAYIDADRGLAQQISTTSVDLGNLSSRTSIAETSVADLKTNEAAARLRLLAVSPGGQAQVDIFSSSSGGAGIALTGNVSIRGDLLVDGTIGTTKVGPNQITAMAVFQPGGGTVSQSADLSTDGGTFYCSGNQIVVRTEAQIRKTSTGTGTLTLTLYCSFNGGGGIPLKSVDVKLLNNNDGSPISFTTTTSPGPVSCTFYVGATVSGAVNTSYSVNPVLIIPQEFKR